jgi:nicotinamidase-related amidase
MVDAPFGATLYKDVTFGPDALELASELGPKPGDIIIDKYGWGSFHGTSLDTHLRRRAISTLIVAGLVSAFGVDTTMREAMARGYEQMLASDATASHTAEEHDHFLRFVAPRLARVRTTDVIIAALQIE